MLRRHVHIVRFLMGVVIVLCVTTSARAAAFSSPSVLRASRVVGTLVDAERPAGDHPVVRDGTIDGNTPAASGVYTVRMESDGR